MSKKLHLPFSPDDARAIMEACSIDTMLADPEEVELLDANNPDLLVSYRRLEAIATSDLNTEERS